MKDNKKIAGIVLLLILVLSSCAKKAEISEPRFNKAATRDIIEGNTWYMRGCYVKALESFNKAHEKFVAQDDQDGTALALNNIGTVYRATKDLESALLFFDEARRIFRITGDSKGLVQSLANKAATLADMSELEKAEKVLSEADKTAEENNVVMPTLKSNRAVLLIKQDRITEAENLLVEAEALTTPARNFEYATIAHGLGLCAEKKGDFKEAIRYYTLALESDRKAGYSKNIALDLAAMGRVSAAMKNHDEALDLYYRSMNILVLLEDTEEAEELSVKIKESLEAAGENKPDLRIREHFLNTWSKGEKKAGLCQ